MAWWVWVLILLGVAVVVGPIKVRVFKRLLKRSEPGEPEE